MKYKEGVISIMIPCYNGKEYISRCFDAILNQTYKKIELIVVDDGSSDNSLEILNSYRDRFLQEGILYNVIHQENKGQAEAINSALKIASGEYITWQDIDDCYCNDSMESMKMYLDENGDIDFVRGKVDYIDNESGQLLWHGESKNPKGTKIFDSYVFQTDSYSFVGIFMARMDFFDKCIKNRKIYPSRGGQNWQLILPMAYKGDCGYLDKVIYNQYVVKGSHSRTEYKNYESEIDRQNTLLDILENVLNDIGVYKEYQVKLEYKYNVKKYVIAYRYNKKKDMHVYLDNINKVKKISFKEKVRLLYIPKYKNLIKRMPIISNIYTRMRKR